MKKIDLLQPKFEDVVTLNKMICDEGNNPHHILNKDRIESAIHSAFYPGSSLFAYGGVAKIAGALCYFLTMGHGFQDGNKRTAVLTAITFLNENGWEIVYPGGSDETQDALAELVDGVAAGKFSKEEMIDWFECHKRLLDE